VLCGGTPIAGPGYFYPPTVVRGVTREMRIASAEVFGPVAAMYRVSSADEALSVANATDFGLGASIWTNDAEEARRLLDGIEAGMVFVNAMVASTPELPFGGVKHSGYGRELAAQGIREFCTVETRWVA
jgi:succinate-semialdehyde dehydrogenase/glutarate-semialdehyde dehydrogenase